MQRRRCGISPLEGARRHIVAKTAAAQAARAAQAALAVALVVSGCGTGVTAGTPLPEKPAIAGVSPATPTDGPPQDVELVFAGDVHFAERTAALLADPANAFGPIAEVLTAADLAVVNLETAVTTRGTAEPKKFHFRAPATAYAAVKAAGVDAVSLGNNHSLDYGPVGLDDTIEHAKQAGIPTFGAGRTAKQAYAPWITKVGGNRIAMLGISQVHELEMSWNATDDRPGVAHARDQTGAVMAIKATQKHADFIVVFMHWGQEGEECPTAEMKSFARKLADAGADLIVGTHAHLLQGEGWLGRTYVAYGLGNFLWWRDDAASNDTGVLRVTLHETKIAKTEFIPASISRQTGQPLPATGAEATRIKSKVEKLHGCTGLADAPS